MDGTASWQPKLHKDSRTPTPQEWPWRRFSKKRDSTKVMGNLAHENPGETFPQSKAGGRSGLGNDADVVRARILNHDIGRDPIPDLYAAASPGFTTKRLGPGILRVHAFEVRTSYVPIFLRSRDVPDIFLLDDGEMVWHGRQVCTQYNIITEVLVLRTVLRVPSVEGRGHTNPTSAQQRSLEGCGTRMSRSFSHPRFEQRAGFLRRLAGFDAADHPPYCARAKRGTQTSGRWLLPPAWTTQKHTLGVWVGSLPIDGTSLLVRTRKRNAKRVFRTTQRRHLVYPTSLAHSRFSVGGERAVGPRATDCRFGTSGMLTATL